MDVTDHKGPIHLTEEDKCKNNFKNTNENKNNLNRVSVFLYVYHTTITNSVVFVYVYHMYCYCVEKIPLAYFHLTPTDRLYRR